MTHVDQLMRAANPVSEPTTALSDEDFEALLLVSQTRSAGMSIKETMTPVEPPTPKRSPWLIAAASFAVIIAVGGMAALLVQSTTDNSPATAAAVAMEAAEADSGPITKEQAMAIEAAYFSSYDDGDVDALITLFDPNVEFSGSFGARSIDELRQLTVWNLAQGTIQTPLECTAADVEGQDAIRVSCGYTLLPGSAAAVGAPVVPHNLRMTISSTGIERFVSNFGQPDFNTVDRFLFAWIQDNHPDDRPKMEFKAWDSVGEAEELGLLRAKYIREWAAYLAENGCEYPVLAC